MAHDDEFDAESPDDDVVWWQTMLDQRDELGTMYRAVAYRSDGSLCVVGADYGDGVEQVFGRRGYDFFRMFSTDEVDRLRELLGEPAESDLQDAIVAAFRSTSELERYAKEHGVPGSFEGWHSD